MYLEIAGILFIVIMSVFMQNLLDLSGHTLIGVMFGSVNDSIWEIEKTLLFPYLLWAGIELLCIKIPFRKFIVAKAVSLWFFCLSYSAICLLYSLTGAQTHFLPEFTAALICCTFSFFHIFPLDGRQQKVWGTVLPRIFYVDAVCGFVLLAHSVPYAQLSFYGQNHRTVRHNSRKFWQRSSISRQLFFAKLFLINLICVII